MTNPDIDTIRRALDGLPLRCRYHGDDFERTGYITGRPSACCDTGVYPWLRRRALDALDRLEATLQGPALPEPNEKP